MIELIAKVSDGYRIILDGAVVFVPDDTGNRHYQMVQEAIANGAVVTVDLPQDQGADIRNLRNQLLTESDWIVLRSLENAASIPTEWVIYRQALRDIPEQEKFPNLVQWPAKVE